MEVAQPAAPPHRSPPPSPDADQLRLKKQTIRTLMEQLQQSLAQFPGEDADEDCAGEEGGAEDAGETAGSDHEVDEASIGIPIFHQNCAQRQASLLQESVSSTILNRSLLIPMIRTLWQWVLQLIRVGDLSTRRLDLICGSWICGSRIKISHLQICGFATQMEVNQRKGLGSLSGRKTFTREIVDLFGGADGEAFHFEAQSIFNPFAYDEYLKKWKEEKMKAECASHITMKAKLPKVNMNLAVRLLENEEA